MPDLTENPVVEVLALEVRRRMSYIKDAYRPSSFYCSDGPAIARSCRDNLQALIKDIEKLLDKDVQAEIFLRVGEE